MCDYRDRVIDYLYDEVPAAERSSLDRHIEVCEVCREDVRAFRRVREDLLAWEVPEQPSVWTPFAPAPVVPWHRQVPAWAMAAAAGLMLMLGTAGGFAASALTDNRGTAPQPAPAVQLSAAPAVLTPPSVDPVLVSSLVRKELSAAGFDTLRNGTAVSVTAPMTARLDVHTEQRLLANAETFVGAAEQRQWSKISAYLDAVAREQNLERRRDGESLTRLHQEVVELREIVNTLLDAQSRVVK